MCKFIVYWCAGNSGNQDRVILDKKPYNSQEMSFKKTIPGQNHLVKPISKNAPILEGFATLSSFY
jgi:hypothetical protein